MLILHVSREQKKSSALQNLFDDQRFCRQTDKILTALFPVLRVLYCSVASVGPVTSPTPTVCDHKQGHLRSTFFQEQFSSPTRTLSADTRSVCECVVQALTTKGNMLKEMSRECSFLTGCYLRKKQVRFDILIASVFTRILLQGGSGMCAQEETYEVKQQKRFRRTSEGKNGA